ncbi:hypothetical protein [Candidatus Entotheonella palauensis]|uniref:hypothetical protein n=1 Tax=Candidatus Entotheonella palauensis TaxID=93172 RepID=UPI001177EDB0|nr:hypothetical protein [Candidatus Entotheonella palauensis]
MLRTDFDAAQSEIMTLQTNLSNIQALNDYVSVEMNTLDGLTGPHVFFTGANVHIRSGSGDTNDSGVLTGLGNLVVGYNEAPGDLEPVAGERNGAHNFIIGREHRYSSFGGLVAGFNNTISGEEASVSGGRRNMASGRYASISGGDRNVASGLDASVSGGRQNTASGLDASVSGGLENTAGPDPDRMSCNMLLGLRASVSGGRDNTACGNDASVSGGVNNTASGLQASVSGGQSNIAGPNTDADPMNMSCDMLMGPQASVSGGSNNTACGEEASCQWGRLQRGQRSPGECQRRRAQCRQRGGGECQRRPKEHGQRR